MGSCKVFLAHGSTCTEFMWADMSSDGSVLLGLFGQAELRVEMVQDADLGNVKPPRFFGPALVGNPKISFHSTGHYKLTGKMGKTKATLDRATVKGPPLHEIASPRRMAEIVLPRWMPTGTRVPESSRDIVLDVTSRPTDRPLRCTIACMNQSSFDSLSTETPMVGTSNWETTGGLANGSHVWTWTMRTSADDEHYPERVYIVLLGPPKWGS